MNLNDRRRDVAKEICRSYGVTLSVGVLRAFADILMPMKVLRGHRFVNEGDVCNYMFYVEKGMLMQHYKKNGMKVTEDIGHENDMVVCIESFFLRQPSKIVVSTIEPSIVYGIPHDELYALASHSFELCQLIFQFYQHSLIAAQQKADVFRFETAKDRYVRTMHEKPEIIRRAPLHNVASLLQMTPETLSRVRALVTAEDIK